jgi:CheY-like chemotaxis protein
VRVAGEVRPRVVISDIGLPGLDGYGVAAALRRDPATAGALLIAVSGYGREEDIQRAREAGFDHYLVKPAAPEELVRLLAAG